MYVVILYISQHQIENTTQSNLNISHSYHYCDTYTWSGPLGFSTCDMHLVIIRQAFLPRMELDSGIMNIDAYSIIINYIIIVHFNFYSLSHLLLGIYPSASEESLL